MIVLKRPIQSQYNIDYFVGKDVEKQLDNMCHTGITLLLLRLIWFHFCIVCALLKIYEHSTTQSIDSIYSCDINC